MHSLAKIGILTLTFATAVAQGVGPPSTTLSPTAVRAAVETLRRDPNLRDDKKMRTLHWAARDTPAPRQDMPAWLASLFSFLTESATAVVWVAGATGLAVAGVWILRVLRSRRPKPQTVTQGSSWVQDLDIDPNSLPDDVGATALTLLHAGRTREAMSLLYRGALSRSVHRFGVAIGESFTEGEALRAVGQHLDRPRVDYFTALVAMWQRAVYAADAPASESVATLCREFAPTFDGAVVA